jgi:reticulon-4-interacting protein 1, mitochondrial
LLSLGAFILDIFQFWGHDLGIVIVQLLTLHYYQPSYSDMATTKAWTFSKRGDPKDVLQLTSDRPMPTLPPPLPLPKDAREPQEWILVKIAYTGLNPGGLFHMTLIPAMFRAKVAIPEMDCSGTVVDVWTPDGTTARFSKGDGVAVTIPIGHSWPTGNGALQTYTAIPAKYAVKKPANVAFRDAAGLFIAACSAWNQVQDAKVKSGDRVLVNGASGGLGTFAVQMAKHIVGPSGYVVGICSERNLELVKSLGADDVS